MLGTKPQRRLGLRCRQTAAAARPSETGMTQYRHRTLPRHALAAAALLWAAGAANAQYKVVAPDGSVTYTDRPPVASNVRVQPVARPGTPGAAASTIGLPAELRGAAQRNPVTLYTATNCEPCDNGRRLLQTRGIPYAEKRVSTEEDAIELERLMGARTLPVVMIGATPLRGFAESDWSEYLTAAGYPKENRLPRGWQQAQPTPLAERAAPTAEAPAPAPPPDVPPPAPGRIRF